MELSEAQKRRAEKWEESFIPCRFHPERRCNRSGYVSGKHRKCGSCKNRRLDGSRNASDKAWDSSEQRRWRDRSRLRYIKIQENKI